MNQLLNRLFEKQNLSFAQSNAFFEAIICGEVDDISLTAALVALKMKGESTDEIAGAASALRQNAVHFDAPDVLLADSCGTGGDGANTINISTTAAIVAAACGLNMVKHGNRSVSSKSGSSDLLSALGVNVEMTPAKARETLIKTGFTFLFAPLYHQGVKHAMPVRTRLKTRTLFNLLGPLANPASPDVQLLGVYSADLCAPMAETLKKLGTRRAMVVHGCGTDEIALHGPTRVAELNDGVIRSYEITPHDFSLANYSLESLTGGDPEYNAKACLKILQGHGDKAHNAAIVANVAALLYLTDKAETLRQGAQQAQAVLSSGKAFETLKQVAEVSHG